VERGDAGLGRDAYGQAGRRDNPYGPPDANSHEKDADGDRGDGQPPRPPRFRPGRGVPRNGAQPDGAPYRRWTPNSFTPQQGQPPAGNGGARPGPAAGGAPSAPGGAPGAGGTRMPPSGRQYLPNGRRIPPRADRPFRSPGPPPNAYQAPYPRPAAGTGPAAPPPHGAPGAMPRRPGPPGPAPAPPGAATPPGNGQPRSGSQGYYGPGRGYYGPGRPRTQARAQGRTQGARGEPRRFPAGTTIRQRDSAIPERRKIGSTAPVAAIALDGLDSFARDLRALRAKAELDYPEMAERSHYTMKTLASAAGGLRLPTLPVAMAFVGACGGDVGEWEDRWHKLAEKIGTDADNKEHPDPEPVADPVPKPAAEESADKGEVYVITSAKPRQQPGW
jgi:hypothetical protein